MLIEDKLTILADAAKSDASCASSGRLIQTAGRHADKYDLVVLGAGTPLFWAEAGRVGDQKLKRVIHRFPRTHFAFAVWGSWLSSMTARVQRQSRGVHRLAAIDVIASPEYSAARFIGPRGTIRVHHSDLNWQRFI
jgi:hypothetical protein